MLWNRFKKQIVKDKKIVISSFLVASAFTLLWSAGAVYSKTVQDGIADKVVRFHVLANSDSKIDQELKLCVRDRVLAFMRPKLENSTSKEETRVLLMESFPAIKGAALSEIQKKGFAYDVKVSLVKDSFPKKTYGDLTFPAGVYDALRIEIGSAKGQNWWCVMFPPMCFVDAVSGNVTDGTKQKLEDTLTREEYSIVETKGNIPIIKFKIVEWWQEKWQREGYDEKGAQAEIVGVADDTGGFNNSNRCGNTQRK